MEALVYKCKIISHFYILFYSRIKGNVDTFESFNQDITYLPYDPFLLTIF